MAKKENDENKDVNQGSEEDFGLPDLEFEELDDIEEEEESSDDLSDEIAEITGETSEPEEENVMEDIGIGNMEEEIQISEEADALDEMEAGLSDTSSDDDEDELDEVDKFISEITADDDATEDAVGDVGDDIGDLSSVGDDDEEEMADVSAGMFARDTDDDDDHSYSSSYEDDDDEGGTSPTFTRIIIFGLVSAVIIAFAFLYFSDGSEETGVAERTPIVKEKPAEEEPAAAAEEETTAVVEETPAEEPAPVVEQQQPVAEATGTPGEITTITASAGRYYVVVASFIDDDLANDHGQELAAQGASVKIISPFNNKKYFRVSVADYSSRQEAVNATEQLKSQYGEDIWALKY